MLVRRANDLEIGKTRRAGVAGAGYEYGYDGLDGAMQYDGHSWKTVINHGGQNVKRGVG